MRKLEEAVRPEGAGIAQVPTARCGDPPKGSAFSKWRVALGIRFLSE